MIKKIKSEKAYAVIQFAFILPIMLIILGLIFDMGRAVHAKMSLQQLAGEIQKISVLYEEEGSAGGLKVFSNYDTAEDSIEEVIKSNTTLDNEKIAYNIKKSDTQERSYIGKYYDYSTNRFKYNQNRNDVQYLTVTVEYEMPYEMFLTKNILGESIKFSEDFTGMMYVGGDGWDEKGD